MIFVRVQPENLLIDNEKNLIKLIDFGDAVKLISNNVSTTIIFNSIGNIEFHAPEIISNMCVGYTS